MNIRSVCALACMLLIHACNDPKGLGVEPEIRNLTDSFEFQVSQLSRESHLLRYSWQNTGTVANVNQAGTLIEGSATLEILDADGTRVYLRSLTDNGTFVTGAGRTGTWTIRVQLVGASGTLNFRVQKRP